MTFELLNQRTTPDSVVEVLRKAILDGGLAPGSQLREVHIAKELGISRAPLREALRMLEEEGLVTKIAFRGSFVTEVGRDTVREIETLRERLEPLAAELALPALRAGGRDRLAGIIGALATATQNADVSGSIDAHLGVHRLFYELSGHRLLLGMWTAWEAQLRLFLAADHQSYANLPAILDDHQRLLGLVDAGDDDALLREVVQHVRDSLLVGTAEAHAARKPTESPARRGERRRRLATLDT